MRQKVMVGLVALLMGMAGVGVGLLAIHLWDDHKILHALVQIETQRQQTAAKASATPEAK